MKNRIFSLLMVIFIVANFVTSVHAVELPEERVGSCSIEVTVQYKGKPIKDGKLTAIRVGYIDHQDYNYFFRKVFKNEPIGDVGSWGSVDEMYKFYRDQKQNYSFFTETVNIHEGKATFSNFDTGLYLIIQEAASSGYSSLSPFLVSVPYWDGSRYRYHVNAQVKTELLKEPVETTEPVSGGSGSTGNLPQTGQLNWPIPWMAVSGMTLFAVGWWLCFGSRKDSQ